MSTRKRLLALIIALLTAVVTTFTGAAAAAAQPYPPEGCASIEVSTTHPEEGATITIEGSNFLPDTDVRLELHTTVFILGVAHTDSEGSFTIRVTLPDGVVGEHTIVAATGAPNSEDCPGDPEVDITVREPGESGGTVPSHGAPTALTGVEVAGIGALGLGLLVAGVVLVVGGKRRRASAIES